MVSITGARVKILKHVKSLISNLFYNHSTSSASNWENYLRRIVDSNWVELEHHPSPFRVPIISPEGIELTKNLTFNELPLSDKIDLFYALCDYRFWCEDASEAIKDYPIEELRLESIGKDSQGYEYWYFSGTRLFREDRELSQDIILRKKRIKELEYTLIELEKNRILREQEEKRKAELEKAKQLANEAKEARLAAKKRQQEQEATNNRKRRDNTPILPPRTGLRERRSSAASNSNDSQQAIAPTTRSKLAKQQATSEQRPSAQKATRSSLAKNSKQNELPDQKPKTPEPPKKSPLEECKEELERIAISSEDRSAAWCIQCESLEEWESFATKFEKTKSTNEKYLFAYLNEELLPKIRAIYAKRASEARRKEKELLLSLASRRVSTRIISKRAQEEEEERKAQIRESELQKKKAEAEIRLRAELEREMRAKRNRFVVNGGASSTCSEDGVEENGSRYNLRQQQHDSLGDSNEFDGIIHPDKLSEFYEALELIIDTVKTSKHAWPFVDPVPDTVPGYYDLIEEPMDLKKLRTKVEFREYKSLIELERDFQLLVNNCEKFNGPKNVYTKMVYKLWKSFRKNVRLYLQRDLHMDEYETFIYPPPAPVVQNANNANNNKNSTAHNGIIQNHSTKDGHPQNNDDAESNAAKCELIEDNCVHENLEDHESTTINNVSAMEKVKTNDDQPKVESKSTEVPMELETELILPPEPVVEEIIIDSYAVPCPDENYFIWPQDIKPVSQQDQ